MISGTKTPLVRALAFVLCCLPGLGRAQQRPSDRPGEPENTGCFDTFTSGSGADLFKICVSRHGNLVRFESPAGQEHIRNGTIIEGYSLCSIGIVSGYDTAQDEAGFDNGMVGQPGGPGTLPITVTRRTLDGLFELKQTLDWSPAEKEVTITMQVKNVSGASASGVVLHRIVDMDIAANVTGSFDNHWAVTSETAFAWLDPQESVGVGRGLALTALSLKTGHAAQATLDFSNASCFIVGDPTPSVGDLGARVSYFLGDIGSGKTKTVKFVYRRF